MVRVRYLELRAAPAQPAPRAGAESIRLEKLSTLDYLLLYRRVGESVLWDQRLQMPPQDLTALLAGEQLKTYVLRNAQAEPLGFCEFDRSALPEIELKNFGLVSEAQGRGLGLWLLMVALNEEWKMRPTRIWLHTDDWDHPAAGHVYQRAGFRVFAVREQPAGPL